VSRTSSPSTASTARRHRDGSAVTDPQHHRFPWRITAIVVAVVAVASVIAGVLLSADRVETTEPPVATASPSSSAAATPLPLVDQRQVTLLLTVRDATRAAVSTVLVGVGGDTGFVAELMLPRDLLLPTVPPMRLEEVDDPTGARTPEQPLETLLGVQVDVIIDLDRLAWAGLIDATGTRVNAQAAEDPAAFALVVDRVLKGLPYEEETVGELLTGLGSMARTTVTNEDASYVLAQVGRQLRSLDVRREPLPVTFLRAGDARVAVTDLEAATEVTRELFPQALLEPGHAGTPRVVLQRAGATIGAATAARLGLVTAGFGVVEDRAEAPSAEATQVVVPGSSEEAMAAGRAVVSALGLPTSALTVSDAADATVDVRVLLGADATVPSP
jgi:hypothetical protein